MLASSPTMDISILLIRSLDANTDTRRQAELELTTIANQPGFLYSLMQLLSQTHADGALLQAGAIYFKNTIRRHWDSDKISAQDKEAVRAHFLPALVRVTHAVRSQMLASLGTIVDTDFPERWPTLITQLQQMLSATTAQDIFAGCLALSETLKRFRWRGATETSPLPLFVKSTFSQLLQVGQGIMAMPIDAPEMGLMLKEVIKIYYNAILSELPSSLRTEETLGAWGALLLQAVQLQAPKLYNDEDEETLSKVPLWRAKKWAYKSLNRLFQRYGNPALETFKDGSYQSFAKHFLAKYAPTILQCYLRQIELQIQGQIRAPKKIVNMQISFLTDAIKSKTTWALFKPHLDSLLSHFIFPLVCFSNEDQELWEDDAVEYLQKKTDPFEDWDNPHTSALQFIAALIKDRPKATLIPILTFLNGILSSYQPNPDQARQKDGALNVLGALSETLLSAKSGVKEQVPGLLCQHVLPELQSPFVFLRVRACNVLRQYTEADDFDFPAPTENDRIRQWQECFLNALQIMHASDLVVRVEAALAVAALIERSDVRDAVVPHLPFIMESLLQLTNAIDMDTLTGAMERFVELFPHELIPFSVQLCTSLRESYLRILVEAQQSKPTASTDNNEEEWCWDENGDKTMAAMGILKTISTLVLSVPDEMADRQVLLEQLELAMMPAIQFTVQQEVTDLYEEAFECVDAILYERKCISPTMWPLFESICHTLKNEGVAFLEEIFPTLDNFISFGHADIAVNPALMESFAGIAHYIITRDDLDESDKVFGFKLMEVMLLNMRGQVDHLLEPFLDMALKPLHVKGISTPLFVHALNVVVNAMYYNPLLTLAVLTKLNASQHVFTLWFQSHTKLTRVHDKKLSAVALMKWIADASQEAAALASVRPMLPTIMTQLLTFLSALPKAEEERKKLEEMYDTDDEEDEDDDDDEANTSGETPYEDEEDQAEEGEDGGAHYDLADDQDVPDDEAAYLEYLQKRQMQRASAGEAEDDDEDEDWVEELGEQLYYETPLDDVNVYQQFQELFHQLSQHRADVYGALVSQLNKEHEAQIQNILAKANEPVKKEKSKP